MDNNVYILLVLATGFAISLSFGLGFRLWTLSMSYSNFRGIGLMCLACSFHAITILFVVELCKIAGLAALEHFFSLLTKALQQ
jgi:hypothetical protein